MQDLNSALMTPKDRIQGCLLSLAALGFWGVLFLVNLGAALVFAGAASSLWRLRRLQSSRFASVVILPLLGPWTRCLPQPGRNPTSLTTDGRPGCPPARRLREGSCSFRPPLVLSCCCSAVDPFTTRRGAESLPAERRGRHLPTARSVAQDATELASNPGCSGTPRFPRCPRRLEVARPSPS